MEKAPAPFITDVAIAQQIAELDKLAASGDYLSFYEKIKEVDVSEIGRGVDNTMRMGAMCDEGFVSSREICFGKISAREMSKRVQNRLYEKSLAWAKVMAEREIFSGTKDALDLAYKCAPNKVARQEVFDLHLGYAKEAADLDNVEFGEDVVDLLEEASDIVINADGSENKTHTRKLTAACLGQAKMQLNEAMHPSPKNATTLLMLIAENFGEKMPKIAQAIEEITPITDNKIAVEEISKIEKMNTRSARFFGDLNRWIGEKIDNMLPVQIDLD